MKIINVITQKGGVGKTTTANAIGAGLSLKGYKVLYVDTDPQCNLTYILNCEHNPSLVDVLTGNATIKDATVQTKQGDAVPASDMLGTAGIIKNSRLLKKALATVKDKYDYIVIDTPPALSMLTINALMAATDLIIPAQADIFSLQGIGQLYETIKAVRNGGNRNLSIMGILITRYNGRAILSRDMAKLLADTAKQIGTRVFPTPIREGVAIKEAEAVQQDIFSYNKRSNPAKDYMDLIEEIIKA